MLIFRVIAGSDAETQVSVTLTIFDQQAATAATATPVSIAYGTLLADSQLLGTATAVVGGQAVTVPGTFTYTNAAGLLLVRENG